MADRTLNTRIKLRYASYSEWQNSSVTLLPGEVAVCYVEENNTEIKNTAPTVLFKVGDGDHVFKDLKWASARAADVHDWAKAESRPEYTKSDVGLGNVRNVEQYSKTEVDQLIAEINSTVVTGDTDTKYQLVQNGTTLKLQSKGKTDVAWSDVSGQSFDLASILENAFALKADKTYVDGELEKYYDKDEADAKFLTAHQDISGKADKTYVDAELAKKADLSYVNEELAKTVALEDYNSKMSGLDNAISGINEGIEGIEGDIEGINEAIDGINGTIEGINTTLSGKANQSYVDEELAKKADKTDLDNYYNKDAIDGQVNGLDERITANANAIEALTNGASTEEIDSVMELVEYVNEHGTEVQGMKDSIKANADAIAVEKGRVDGIVADYLTSSDKTGLENAIGAERERVDALVNTTIPDLDSRLQAVEGKPFGDYATKSEVEAVDDKADGIDARLQVVEGDYLKASDKTSLEDAINVEKGRVDALINTTIPALDDKIEALEGKPFDDYATKAEVEAVSSEVTKVDNRLKAVEADYLKGADKEELLAAVGAEKTRAEAAESALSTRIKDVEDNYLSSLDTIIWDCGGAE